MKKLAILLLSIGLIAASCNKADVTVTPTPQLTPPPPPAPNPPPSSEVLSGETTISVTSTGFTPATITVKKGTKVNFKNNNTAGVWPASNPHPTHTDLPGFDALKAVAAGGTYSYTFTQVGTWGYHDHLFPSHGGKVTVVE